MMVYQSECVPLSRILPQLYLGAESDITQDCLSGRGISYVLSVSRCCPQPSFLPQSQYLRIPIDDSLRDDLLPWIPQALHFIDGAISLGCSVIVHCAAGISRSPALAVAYVMYSLGMDLDHAYRFVKERRPTISPNFNFLGQLQLFQGTLPLSSDSNPVTKQPIAETLEPPRSGFSPGLSASGDKAGSSHKSGNLRPGVYRTKPELTLSLSDELRNLSLNADPIKVQEAPGVAPRQPAQLQLPSLLEKRKSLTLSLTPLCSGPQTSPAPHNDPNVNAPGSTADRRAVQKIPQNEPPAGATPTRCTKSRSQKRRSQVTCSGPHGVKDEQTKPRRERRKRRTPAQGACVPSSDRQAALTGGAAGADGAGDQSPLSPINVTMNRLLGWGERMVLGVLLGPHIKLGQAPLPYRC